MAVGDKPGPLPAQETYDRLASIYDRRWVYYTEATLQATLEGLELRDGERVLDLATGTGEVARRLLTLNPEIRITGLDVSRAMLEAGRTKSISSAYQVVQGTVDRLPFPDGVFDRVMCSNSFHHFHAPDQTLAEMSRVLRPAGMLTLTDWCDDYISCKVCSLYLRLIDSSFERSYTLKECRRRVEQHGFAIHSARRFKIDWLWGLMRIDARFHGT